jgi:hypothetical protein
MSGNESPYACLETAETVTVKPRDADLSFHDAVLVEGDEGDDDGAENQTINSLDGSPGSPGSLGGCLGAAGSGSPQLAMAPRGEGAVPTRSGRDIGP